MPTPFEMHEEAAKALGAFESAKQSLHDEFTAKGQAVPKDREEQLDRAWADYSAKKDAAESAIKGANRERQIEADKLAFEQVQKSAGRLPVGAAGEGANGSAPTVVYKGRDNKAESYTPFGREHFSAQQEAEYTTEFRRYVAKGEFTAKGRELAEVRKGLQHGLDTSGGFWAAPEVFEKQLIEAIDDLTFMRSLCDVRSGPKGVSFVVRTASALSAAEWTSELTNADADTSTPAGARRITPHPLTKRVIASEDELDADEVAGEAWIMRRMGALFAAAEESAFMTGTGSQQPEGLFVSSLPTDEAAASTTTLVADDLKDVVGALKAQYKPGASWLLHRTTLLVIAKLATGDDQYIWQPSFTLGNPSALLGFPVNESEYVPATLTAGLYAGALGNYKAAYRIQDVAGTQFKRLSDSGTGNNVYFDGRRFVDGMVVDGQGIVRLKMAAA